MVRTSVPAAKATLAKRPLPLPAEGAMATESDIAMTLEAVVGVGGDKGGIEVEWGREGGGGGFRDMRVPSFELDIYLPASPSPPLLN